MNQIAVALHEASGQDITFQSELAYSLVGGGGKPGQGFPCVMLIQLDRCAQETIRALEANMSMKEN